MASFLYLPPELSQAILVLLDTRERSRLSRSSKSFHKALVPQLYCSIDWNWKQPPFRQPPLYLFLRSILENSALGNYIEEICLESSPRAKPSTIWSMEEASQTTGYNSGLVLRAIQATGLPSPSSWIQAVKDGVTDACVALLLSQAPYLKSLRLGYEFQVMSVFTGAILKHSLVPPGGCPRRFPRLRHVECCIEEGLRSRGIWYLTYTRGRSQLEILDSIDINLLLSFFYLENIEDLTLFMPEPLSFSWPGRPPTASNLTSLTLHHSEAKEETLESVLATTPQLSTLNYNLKVDIDGFPKNKSTFVTSNKIGRALQSVASTLERLNISVGFFTRSGGDVFACHYPGHPTGWGIKNSIGSLKNFTYLQELDITTGVLLGFDIQSAPPLAAILPKSLCHVTLRDEVACLRTNPWSDKQLLSVLRDFLPMWKETTPDLQSFTFFHRWDVNEIWVTEERAVFRKRIRGRGRGAAPLFVHGRHDTSPLKDLKSICQKAGFPCQIVKSWYIYAEERFGRDVIIVGER